MDYKSKKQNHARHIHKPPLLHAERLSANDVTLRKCRVVFLKNYYSLVLKQELSCSERRNSMYHLSKVFYLQTKCKAELNSSSHRGGECLAPGSVGASQSQSV